MNRNKIKTEFVVPDDVAAGAAIYSNFLLALYDIEVLMFEMPVIFKCPLRKVQQLYDNNITNKHLDIGVGTGYFLHKSKFPSDAPTIHLMDLNANSLNKTEKRIKRYSPISHRWNVLDPINFDLPIFDSISASNFLHCLPGSMLDKEAFFINLNPHLRKGGTFFGTTVIGKNINMAGLFKKMNKIYNEKGIFCNIDDSLDDLEKILSNNFTEHSVELVGSIALFKGVK